MSVIKIDTNARPQPFLENLPQVSSELVQEITNAAIPILSLFPSIALFTTVGVGGAHIGSQLYSTIHHFSESTYTELGENLFKVSLTTASVALPVLLPGIGAIPGQLYSLVLSMRDCYLAIVTNDHAQAAKYLVSCLSTIVFTVSLIYMTPEWIFISVLMQTLNEISRMDTVFQSEKYIETAVHLLLTIVRGYSAFSQGQTLFRNHYGEKISTMDQFKNLLKEAEARSDKSLDKLLVEKAISSYVQDLEHIEQPNQQGSSLLGHVQWLQASGQSEQIEFSVVKEQETKCFEVFNGIDFSRVYIKNCDFSFCEFNQCRYEYSRIEDTGFYASEFTDCLFNHTKIISSVFCGTVFQNCQIFSTTFSSCEMLEVNFNSSRIVQSVFESVELLGSIFDSEVRDTQFIDTDFSYSEITHSTLEKNLFLRGNYEQINLYANRGFSNRFEDVDLSESSILEDSIFEFFHCVLPDVEKPKIILSWDCEGVGVYTYMEHEALTGTGSQVISARYLPPGVDVVELENEMNEIFASADHNERPIAQTIMSKSSLYPNIGKVVAYANDIVMKADGVVLPGGEDVNPKLYGRTPEHSYYSNDRDLFEVALLDAARRYDKPVMGICRGSQIGNVYYGGTLQNVEGHFGREVVLQVEDDLPESLRKTLAEIFEGEFLFPAMHHQASDKIGEGFYVVSRDEGIPKLLISEDGSRIFSQVHPEASYQYVQLEQWGINPEEYIRALEKYNPEYVEIFKKNYESGFKAKRLFEYFREQALASRLREEGQMIA